MVEQDRYGANPFNIYVHNHDYTQRRRIGSYAGMELGEEFGFNIGGGTLTLPADHPLAPRIMQASHDVVPVTAHKDGWKWTGTVKSYEASGRPGREVLTANLVDDKDQLANIVAYAHTRMPLAMQGKRDHQTGRLEAVAYHYLSENIARSELNAYVMMPPPLARDNSPIVDVVARMTRLDVLLRDVLDQHDYNLVAKMWWPGEPFPEGKFVPLVEGTKHNRLLTLTRANTEQALNPDGPPIAQPTVPGLIVSVEPVRDRPYVRFSTRANDVVEFKLTGQKPGPATAIVGGKSDEWINELIALGIDAAVTAVIAAVGGALAGPAGAIIGGVVSSWLGEMTQDTIFAFTDRKDVQRAAEMGPFHPRESFTSSSSGVFTYDTSALAERELLDTAGGQAIEMTIADGISKVLGNDQRASNGKIKHGWQVGDRCTFEEHLSGVVVSDIISGVTVSDLPDQRVRITPRIGKRKHTSNPFLDMTTNLSKLLAYQVDTGLSA